MPSIFADRLLPVPQQPQRSSPFGMARPYARPSSLNTPRISLTHVLNRSRPPTDDMLYEDVSMYSSRPVFRSICCLNSWMCSGGISVSSPHASAVRITDCATAALISKVVKPRKSWSARSGMRTLGLRLSSGSASVFKMSSLERLHSMTWMYRDSFGGMYFRLLRKMMILTAFLSPLSWCMLSSTRRWNMGSDRRISGSVKIQMHCLFLGSVV